MHHLSAVKAIKQELELLNHSQSAIGYGGIPIGAGLSASAVLLLSNGLPLSRSLPMWERVYSRGGVMLNDGRRYAAAAALALTVGLAGTAEAGQFTEIVTPNVSATGETVSLGGGSQGGSEQFVIGGAAYNGVIGSRGYQILSDGGVASGTTINSIGYQQISSGGTAIATTVNRSGDQNVRSGGTAIGTIIAEEWGDQRVYDGGVAIDTSIGSNGMQFVYSGGSASGVIVADGGQQHISAGATIHDVSQHVGGNIIVEVIGSDGYGADLIFSGTNASGQTFSLSNGVGSNFILYDGGYQIVSYGGKVFDTIVHSGANQYIGSNGSSMDVVQHSGGNIDVSVGGNVSNFVTGTNADGQTFTLSNGIASNFILWGSQYISSGGKAYDTIIHSGGKQRLASGGSSIDVSQHSGGNIIAHVSSNGTAYVSGINASGQTVTLEDGVASNFILYDGGSQHIASDGSAYHTIINSGASQVLSNGGSAMGTLVNSGGKQYLWTGGSSFDVTQAVGGNIDTYVGRTYDVYVSGTNASGSTVLLENGSASNFILYDRGRQYVNSGGKAFDTIIHSGGDQIISDGGSSIDVSQLVGGNISANVMGNNSAFVSGTNASGSTFILSNGVASNFILYEGGRQGVSSGGTAFDTIVNSGANQYLSSGGSTVRVTQHSGGNINADVIGGYSTYVSGTNASGQTVTLQSGVASNFILYSNGWQNISTGGKAFGTIIDGGSQRISNGGSAIDAIINLGLQVVLSGGTAIGTGVASGGMQDVRNGASAIGTIISSGGEQQISSGGSSLDFSQHAGGIFSIDVTKSGSDISTYMSGKNALGGTATLSGGVASNFILYSGASQAVYRGGSAYSTVVDGGLQTVGVAALASGTIIENGGRQYIGGVAVDTSIGVGGGQQIGADASALGGTIDAGGLQSVSGYASGFILSGGTQAVFSSGVARDTEVSSGGIAGLGGWNYGSTVIRQNGSAQFANFDSGSVTMSGGSFLGTNTFRNADLIGEDANLVSNASLIFDPTQNYTLRVAAGVNILGSGSLTKIGAGTLAFNGTAPLAGLAMSGGKLTGNGTVGSLSFAGGSFAPVLDVANPLANVFTVSGAVTGLAGATLAPTWAGNPPTALSGQPTSFLVLDAGSLDNGTAGFGVVDLVGYLVGQTVSASGTRQQLYLDFTSRAMGLQAGYGYAMSPNAFNVAGILDAAESTILLPDLATALAALPADADVVATAINQLHHETAVTAQLTGVRAVRLFDLNLPTVRALDTGPGRTAPIRSANALGSIAPARPNAFTIFASPFGSWANQRSNNQYSGYTLDLAGFALGGLRTHGNFQYGFTAGYDRQRQKMKDYSARIDADLLHLALFAGWKSNNVFIDASVGYSHAWNDLERNVSFPGYSARNTGKFGQDFWSGRFALGYIFELSACVNLIPGIGLDYVHARAKGFTESGSPSALAVAANSYTSLELPISLTLEKTFRTPSGAILVPRIGAAWIPELADKQASTGAYFVQAPGAGALSAQSVSPGRSRGQLSAGLRAQLNDRVTLGFDYRFDCADRYSNHNLAASLGIAF